MFSWIYFLVVLPFVVLFVIGFLSHRSKQSQVQPISVDKLPEGISPELFTQLQKDGYIDASGKPRVLDLVFSLMSQSPQ